MNQALALYGAEIIRARIARETSGHDNNISADTDLMKTHSRKRCMLPYLDNIGLELIVFPFPGIFRFDDFV